MKAIMISVRPEWTLKILNKEKILEIRTSCPKEWKDYLSGKTKIKPQPMKGYIYCTKGKSYKDSIYVYHSLPAIMPYIANGKVIAEFILNKVDRFGCRCVPYSDENNLGYEGFIDNGVYYDKDIGGYVFERYDKYIDSMLKNKDLDNMCLTPKELLDYTGLGKDFYAWHIDNLKIYDKPKELSEFEKTEIDLSKGYGGSAVCPFYARKKLTRPFQSWGYVNDLEEV